MEIRIVREPMSKADLARIAEGGFGDFVKAVVDLERVIMAIGSEMHADAERVLLEDGSKQSGLWGINLYPAKTGDDLIEFDSMINIRPLQGNRSRGVENPEVRSRIREVIRKLVAE